LYALSGSHIYPRCTLLNIVKRNGFNNKASDLIASQDLIPKILKDNKAETLIKTRQYELLKRYIISNDLQYWNQIKIAIRNNYIVNNVNDWYDYLHMLTALRKDIHNPKYVCPTDFYEAHQKVLAKHQELRRKQKLAKLIEEIEIDNEEYIKQKQFFFDLHFKYGIINPNINENTMYGYHCTYDENNVQNRVGDIFFYSDSKTFNTLCDFYNNTDMIPNELKDWSIPPEFSWFHYVTKNNININVNHWDIKVMRNNIDEVKNKNFDYEIL
jgi:hypothetical protein